MLSGILVPVCTPFKGKNQEIDVDVFCNHIEWLIQNKVHIIGVNCGTGEFGALGKEEKMHLAEVAAKTINGRARLLVQTSALRHQEAAEFSKHAEGIGADVVMVHPPYFDGDGDDAVLYHYECVSKAVNIPILAYNYPAHWRYDITPEKYKRICANTNVQYIKDSTGDMLRLEQLVALGAKVFLGWDTLSPFGLMSGAVGLFWGGANLMPAQAVKLYELHAAGKLVEMDQLWKTMRPANVVLMSSPQYNAAVKAGMRLMGHDMGECRLPVPPAPSAEVSALKEALACLK